MKLPYREQVQQEQIASKLTTYDLNTEHRDGKHKAQLSISYELGHIKYG